MFYFSFNFVTVSFCCRYVVLHRTITGPGNSPTTEISQTRTNKQEQKTTLLFHRNQVQIYTKNGIYYKKTPLCRNKRVQIEKKKRLYYKKVHYFVGIGWKQNMGYIINRSPLFRSNRVQLLQNMGYITNRPHHFVDISTFSMPFSKLNEKTKTHSLKFSIIYNNVLLLKSHNKCLY